MGAWIETAKTKKNKVKHNVAPYVGAWIETQMSSQVTLEDGVAPYVGAWIETNKSTTFASDKRSRTLHGCVD